ncbi:MAG: aminomethyl-transferring glycine dehydrogenase subunit GcvPA [Candidatus Chloroheliales bacterium]|nr:MAG: aminomethyl-transferring glycine dehydrogenase subunit GcvPA [Chloroflexota bacterium]
MVFSPHTAEVRAAMLQAIGVEDIEQLYVDVPAGKLNAPIDLPAPLSEPELIAEIRRISATSADVLTHPAFLGAGAYNHFIPSAIRFIQQRGEFQTSYTPYQPELSQGTLQSIYELQTLVCELTGMDVTNAGMYDGSTSVAEAALMATVINKRKRIAVSDALHPHSIDVLRTYADGHKIGVIATADPLNADLSDVAAVIVQQPDFFGRIADLRGAAERIHAAGALFIIAYYPIALGLLKSPGEYDADIAVGEGQPLGSGVNFGGPYNGLMSCKAQYVRSMPGRIVGQTKDVNGRRGYVLTLQTREQHIRREKATSNICTNSALIALGSTVYMCLMGKQGLQRVAQLSYNRAHYLAERVAMIPGYKLHFSAPFFNEFVVEAPTAPADLNKRLWDEAGIIGGYDVSDGIANGWLLCATEMTTKTGIDKLVSLLQRYAEEK